MARFIVRSVNTRCFKSFVLCILCLLSTLTFLHLSGFRNFYLPVITIAGLCKKNLGDVDSLVGASLEHDVYERNLGNQGNYKYEMIKNISNGAKSTVSVNFRHLYPTFDDVPRSVGNTVLSKSVPVDLNGIRNRIVLQNISTTAATCNYVPHPFFPLCSEMMDFLKTNLNREKCYYDVHKVKPTNCSILNYLTLIEPYCVGERRLYNDPDSSEAIPRSNLNGLLNIFSDKALKWLKERAKFVWPYWLKSAQRFSSLNKKYKKKHVIAFMGAFGKFSWFLELAGKGGPLGELVQWVDLISVLYVLGYDITLARDPLDLSKILVGNDKNMCATGRGKKMVDIIYTDITGINVLTEKYGSASLVKYKCKFRILDSFGTYSEYNYPNYPYKIPGGKSIWGHLNVLLTQFLTLYPHTHDNSFLGFVVTKPLKNHTLSKHKKNIAVLYAKHSVYLKGYERFLEIISQFFQIHATCVDDKYTLPPYVHNHGPVSLQRVQQLLSEAKLFIGVGFPYEGPGPIEAMAAGTTYIQPKFHHPRSSINTEFFYGKPTSRELTSQSPYMEEFVGEPYCYTLNVSDEGLVRKILGDIKKRKGLPPKIPKEFTNDGMIERVYAYTSLMDYCNPYSPRWPPLKNMQVMVGDAGKSCKDTCMSKGLVCEHSYFHDVNSKNSLEKSGEVKCQVVTMDYYLHSPSFDPFRNICYTQKQEQLFSCMHYDRTVRRLCPCRDYTIEQTAICRKCL